MRFIRLLGVTMSLYGSSYVMYALMQYFGYVPYTAEQHVIELNVNIGLFTFVIGIGLVLTKEWARVACLSAVTLLLSIHIFLLGLSYLTGTDPTMQVMNVILIVLLFLVSWSKLTKPGVKQLFR